MKQNFEAIQAAILSKYRTLAEPQFHFIQLAADADEYRDVIQALGESFEVEEDTDTNYDVSFVLYLHGDFGILIVRLSMVGRYAALLRVDPDNRAEIVSPEDPANHVERQVVETLQHCGVEVLTPNVLKRTIPLALSNEGGGDSRLYQALFDRTEVLPWKEDD